MGYITLAVEHKPNYNAMKNLCVLKTTISVFRWIIIGPYYVGRGSQTQLNFNKTLVRFENGNFNFSSDYCWYILRWPWITNPTKLLQKTCAFRKWQFQFFVELSLAYITLAVEHKPNYNTMKNLCILKLTISIFCQIIVGIYHAGRGTQTQLNFNEKLVYFENDNFNFSSDYRWPILRRPQNKKPTTMQ